MSSPEQTSKSPNVAKAGGIMMASLIISRFLGLARDTVMAAKFGIGLDTDAYRIAFTIPDMLFFLIAGGGLSSAFIPVFSELLHTEKENDAWDLFSVITTITSLIILALIGLAWVFAPAIAHFMAKGKPPEIMPQIIDMSRIMLPAQYAFLIGGVLFGTLYARQKFVAPGLAPNVYNVGIIVGALLISNLVHPGIEGMAWGALLGAVVGNLIIPTGVMLRLGGHYKFSVDLNTPGAKKVFKLMLPVILGFSLPSVVTIITQKFASAYPGGINTALNLSNNLMQAPQGIFGQSLALAAFPALSQFFAQGRMDMYRGQLARSLKTVIYLSVPAGAFMFALAFPIVNLAYGYGRAGHDTSLGAVAACLQIYAFGVFAWCMHPVLMRGFFSIHKTAQPIILGTLMTAGFIGLYYAFHSLGMGYLALPASSSLSAILLCALLWIPLEKEVGSLGLASVTITLVKSIGASAVSAFFAWGVWTLVHPHGKIVSLLLFVVIFCASGWIYYFITRALKMPETEYMDRALSKINKMKRPISEVEAHSE